MNTEIKTPVADLIKEEMLKWSLVEWSGGLALSNDGGKNIYSWEGAMQKALHDLQAETIKQVSGDAIKTMEEISIRDFPSNRRIREFKQRYSIDEINKKLNES